MRDSVSNEPHFYINFGEKTFFDRVLLISESTEHNVNFAETDWDDSVQENLQLRIVDDWDDISVASTGVANNLGSLEVGYQLVQSNRAGKYLVIASSDTSIQELALTKIIVFGAQCPGSTFSCTSKCSETINY